MTCIIGLKYDGCIYMGADSAGVKDWDISIRKDPKVFVSKILTTGNKLIPIVMGFTTSFRFGQILKFHLDYPIKLEKLDPYEYVVKLLVPEIRYRLKEGGYIEIHDSREEGGVVLIGLEGRLFRMGPDFEIGEREGNFESCGCGEHYALTYLKTVEDFGLHLSPQQKINGAMGMANYFCCGVCPPYIVEVIK